MNENDLRERVRRELDERNWSVRQLATAGGNAATNTTLSNWLRGNTSLADKVRRCVQRGFDWPANWPDDPPPLANPVLDVPNAQLAQLLEDVLGELRSRDGDGRGSASSVELAGELGAIRAILGRIGEMVEDLHRERRADAGRRQASRARLKQGQ